MFFVASAFAADTGSKAGGLVSFLSIMVPVGIFYYFLLMRPQQKKAKLRKELLGNLKKGDKVVMIGGEYGVVHKVISEREVLIELSKGVCVKFLKGAVSSMAESEPSGSSKSVSVVKKSSHSASDPSVSGDASSEVEVVEDVKGSEADAFQEYEPSPSTNEDDKESVVKDKSH
jgi:preprotein translocase subunit YajC